MQPQLIPERLTKLIEHHGLTITQLHEISHVSRRQIHDLKAKEDPTQPVAVRKVTLERLAGALKVKPGVLSGQIDLDLDAAAAADRPRHELSAKISARTRQRYDLACHRYGVTAEELLEIAPLLLTIVAEDSLKWRRKRLKKHVEMLYTMNDLLQFRAVNLFESKGDEEEAAEILRAEQDSIDRNELFGKSRMEKAEAIEPRQFPTNSFTDYLEQKVFADLGPDFLDFEEYGDGSYGPFGFPMIVQWRGENLPQFRLLSTEIRQLLGISTDGPIGDDEFKALFALNHCQVDPQELRQAITKEMTSAERARIALDLMELELQESTEPSPA